MNDQRVQAIEQCLFFMRVYKLDDTVSSKFEYAMLSRRIKEIAELEVTKCQKNLKLGSH